MIRIRAWVDEKGYALQFEDSRLELSHDGMNEFIESLRKLQQTDIDSGETLATEFCVDLEDQD